MLQLCRRLIILASPISDRYHCEVRVATRLKRDLRFTVLYLVSLRYAYRLLRTLSLNAASRAKCKGARVSDQARALIRRVNFGRCLAIYGKGSVN